MKKQTTKTLRHKPISKRDYYKKLIAEHKNDLAKARRLISLLLDRLASEIEQVDGGYLDLINQQIDSEKPKSKNSLEVKFWWGEKESASSILTKMIALLLKLIPLELEIARLDLSKAEIAELEEVSSKVKIDKDDIEIIDMYAERILKSRT